MEMTVGTALIEIRKSMGFDSAKSFHRFMAEKFEIGFNYSYYMRVEKNSLLPSNKIISTIASFLSPENAQKLVLCYCSVIFPKQKYLFKEYAYDEFEEEELTPFSIETQIELTKRQVSVVGRTKANYYLFWLITLSRYNLKLDKLSDFFKKGELDKSLTDLSDAKLLLVKDEFIHVSNREIKFPKANDNELKKIYKQFDEWDEEITSFFNFKNKIKKKIARRVSPRYLELLESQLNNLLEFVNAAEEVDVRYNNEVCMINIEMFRGNLPG